MKRMIERVAAEAARAKGSAHPYLVEMPAAPCPEGCVVRKGDRLGSVTLNRDGRWAVTEHGARNGRIGLSHGGSGTPEADGWRHALDHRGGFWSVFAEVSRFAYEWAASGANMHNASMLLMALDEVKGRHLRGTATAEDLVMMAKNFGVAHMFEVTR